MNELGDFKNQIVDLTVELSALVAERIFEWTKDFEPGERAKIIKMIENNLPTVIANAIEKSPSMHTASGIDYFVKNMDSWADAFAKKFINP